MKYLIRSQRDGWYFTGFEKLSGAPIFGKIHDSKIFSCKGEALMEMRRMGQYGQRIVAVTRMGRNSKIKDSLSAGII